MKCTTVALGVLSRWGAKLESTVPFRPGSYCFCRCASAVITQHARQRKGQKRKFIFSIPKPMASSLFILLIYLTTSIANVSRVTLYRKTRHWRMSHAYMGNECREEVGILLQVVGCVCLSSSSTLCNLTGQLGLYSPRFAGHPEASLFGLTGLL